MKIMKTSSRIKQAGRITTLLMIFGIAAACSSNPKTTERPPPPPGMVEAIDPYLEVGTSQKRDVHRNFGKPTATFEDGRLWTYRIYRWHGYYGVSRNRRWYGKQSLVLVFDNETGALIDWELVSTRRESNE